MPRTIVYRSKQKDDTPATLASELSQARQTYETRRDNVITRAQSRVTAIDAVKAELEAEREAHLELLRSA